MLSGWPHGHPEMFYSILKGMNPLLSNRGFTPAENNKTVSSQVVRIGSDSTLKYFIAFLVVGTGLSVWLSYLFIGFNTLPTLKLFLVVQAVSLLLAVIMLFQTVLVQSRQFSYILIAAELLGLLTFFYYRFSFWFFLALLGFFLLWLQGFLRARGTLDGSIKVHFWRYGMVFLTSILSAFAMFWALFYAGLFYQSGGISLPAYTFVMTAANAGVEYAVPNFNPQARVDVFLYNLVSDELKNDPSFTNAPEAVKEQTLLSAAELVQQKIEAFTSLTIKPDETVVEYTYRLVLNGIKSLQERGLGAVLVLGILAFIFFTIKGAMFVIKWPLMVIVFLIYLLLQSVGVISIAAEMRQKELLSIK